MSYKSKWVPQEKLKLRVMQKFIADYRNLWPVLKPWKAREYDALCDVCKTDFSILQSSRHVLTKKHVGVAKLKTENKSVFQTVWELGSYMWQICGIPENVPRFQKSVFHIPDKRHLGLASQEKFAKE